MSPWSRLLLQPLHLLLVGSAPRRGAPASADSGFPTLLMPRYHLRNASPLRRLTGTSARNFIYKPNDRTGEQVKALLEEFPDKGLFSAFGAGHFMGNNMVLDVLWCEGYEVEHTPAGRPINEENKSPSLQPTSSAIFAAEVPTPEALVTEAGSKVYSLWLPLVAVSRSASLPGQAGRKFWKKWRRPKQRQGLQQFSDLWLRLEESAVVPPFQVPTLAWHISAELRLHRSRLSHHSRVVAGRACLSLWTPVFWLLALAFQTETPLL